MAVRVTFTRYTDRGVRRTYENLGETEVNIRGLWIVTRTLYLFRVLYKVLLNLFDLESRPSRGLLVNRLCE